jgi:predicted Zn-dependent protease
MASKQTAATWARLAGALRGVTRSLLLVPEAALIAALLCAYWALRQPPLIGLMIAALIISFITRTLALVAARLALEAARPHEAKALVQTALALYPWSADGLALCGAIALASNQPAEAELALRRAVGLLPDRPNVYAALSCALLELGHLTEASEAARSALALEPACAIAHLYLAEAEQARGAPAQEVEERLRAGLAVAAPPEAEAALRCALGAHLLAERRIAEATLTLHGAEALVPRCAAPRQIALRMCLGELMVAQGQIERAREHFRSVAALDPNGRYACATWRASHLL